MNKISLLTLCFTSMLIVSSNVTASEMVITADPPNPDSNFASSAMSRFGTLGDSVSSISLTCFTSSIPVYGIQIVAYSATDCGGSTLSSTYAWTTVQVPVNPGRVTIGQNYLYSTINSINNTPNFCTNHPSASFQISIINNTSGTLPYYGPYCLNISTCTDPSSSTSGKINITSATLINPNTC